MTSEVPRGLRILQVSAYAMDRFGGVQSHIRSLGEALRAASHDVRTVSPGTSASDRDNIYLGRARGVTMASTKFEVSLVGRDELRQFKTDMEAWQPDIIHIHGLWVPFLPWQVMRAVSAARVVTFHDTPPPGPSGAILRSIFKPLSRLILNHCDGAIAVSALPLGHLRPGPRGMKPKVIAPMVDLQPFNAITKPPLETLNTVLFWGRFEGRKGVETLLQAIQMIEAGEIAMPAKVSKVRFVLAGKGAAGAAAQFKAKAGGSRVETVFLEALPQEALMKQLEEARLVVLPSLYGESFGIVIIETMASGTPVIVADNPGYRAALQGQFDSSLFPAGDAKALARKIVEGLQDAAMQKAQAEAGKRYCQQFDVTRNLGVFLEVYENALDHASRSKRLASGN